MFKIIRRTQLHFFFFYEITEDLEKMGRMMDETMGLLT